MIDVSLVVAGTAKVGGVVNCSHVVLIVQTSRGWLTFTVVTENMSSAKLCLTTEAVS